LRPKLGSDKVTLLPVCLPQTEGQLKNTSIDFYFEIYRDKPKKKKRKPQWRFRMRDSSKKIIIKSEDYKHLHDCKYAISLIKKTLTEGGDIRILKSDHDRYYFNMVAKNREIFCTSNFWKTRSEVEKKLEELSIFYKGGTTLTASAIKDFDKDPYSFRISVILPSWPEKFRNINFRRFVEKTIRMETPAHIYPRICWIDLLQMREFEKVYKAWLSELTKNRPDTESMEKTNNMINALFNLKNVYPVVKLHDCQYAAGDEPQVILDYSALGII